MTTRTPTRMSAAQRREQLLDVTKRLVDERGFHAVSMEAVARAAGITRPIVYHHFARLEDLLLALFDRETGRALEQLAGMLSRRSPDLLASLDAYLGAVGADPVTWRIVLMPPEGTPEELRARVRDGRAAFAAALTETGAMDSPDPELTGRVLQALADEAARLLLENPDRYPRDRLVAQARWLIDALRGAA